MTTDLKRLPAASDEPRKQQQLELDVLAVERPGPPVREGGSRTRLGPRLALSPDEAAALLGVSRDFFDEHVISELRIVRRGRRILVPLRELERWLDDVAVHPVDSRLLASRGLAVTSGSKSKA